MACFGLLVLVLLGLSFTPGLNQTFLGVVARFALGSGLAEQELEDLRMDVKGWNIVEVQQWLQKVENEFHQEGFERRMSSDFFYPGQIQIEIPDRLIPVWLEKICITSRMSGDKPKLTLCLSSDGKLAYIAFHWYLKGIIFLPTTGGRFDISDWDGYPIGGLREVHPGIYVYVLQRW